MPDSTLPSLEWHLSNKLSPTLTGIPYEVKEQIVALVSVQPPRQWHDYEVRCPLAIYSLLSCDRVWSELAARYAYQVCT